MKKISRRQFLVTMSAMTAAGVMTACGSSNSTTTSTAASGSTAANAEQGSAKLMDSPMKFKVATTQSSSGLWVKYMTTAYEEITERTNGDLQFTLYPDSELGNNNDCVEQILAGAPVILGCGFDTLTDQSDKLAVASSPYVFQDMSEVFELAKTDWWDTTTAELAASENLQIFAVGTLGYRHFVSSKPITSPTDISKLIVRMGSDLMRNWISVMGGSPASGAWADNYSNIQSGVFDACEATLDLLWSSSLYEVCGYLTLSGHSINPNISIMSAENWNKIPAEYQQIMIEVMESTMADIYDETVANESKIISDFEGKGVKILDADKAAFAEYTDDLLAYQGMDTSILEEVNKALGR